MFKEGDFVCMVKDTDHWGRVVEVKGDEVFVFWGITGCSWWKSKKLIDYNFGGSR